MSAVDPVRHRSQAVSAVDPLRRKLLGWGVAAAGVTLAPGITLFEVAQGRPPAEPASKSVRWGLLIDANRCAADCSACVTACQTENGLPAPTAATAATAVQWIRKVELKSRTGGPTRHAPVMCQHCAHPPCVDVCPTGASFKRADGIVLVDRHICIGCRYCMLACPYKARSFVHEPVTGQQTEVPRGKGCVESCTLCVHRIDRDQIPACVEACAAAGHHAILFGDLNDPNSEIRRRIGHLGGTASGGVSGNASGSASGNAGGNISGNAGGNWVANALRPDLRLDPGVRYQGL